MIQRVAEPFRPSSQIPEWIWKRIPIVGTFPVEVTDNKAFLYRSIGEPAGKVLYWRGNWGFEEGAPQIFYKLAQTAQTFFDIGAYVGYYTLLAATANPNIQVFAFEPVPSINARLHEHIQMNHFHRNTTIEQVVLSDKVERTIPFTFPYIPGLHHPA
ncbi:MAG: FkbM family methyltransferase [Caldilineaceae bacterium]